ncbi:hypothetical protein [Akkermansia sp.]|uniref:hypothetical protein n=1 Tax=Akkermansia sp. TaxID=1872421 RepID=UPI003AB7307A
MNNYIDDIPQATATHAFYWTYFSPERRGEMERQNYADAIEQFRKYLEKYLTGENAARIPEELERFREGLKTRTLAYLHSHSNCASSVITGGSNFPVARMMKRSRWADAKAKEMLDFVERAKKSVKRRYYNDPHAPIKSSDADAVERLEAKITSCKEMQETMKAANAVIRKAKGNKEQAIAGLIKMGLGDHTANKILTPDFCGRIGFPSYLLSNNLAEIKRLEGRLLKVKRAQETAPEETETESGIRIEKCPQDNRIRIYFPGKPEKEIRSLLKAHGFRWSPRLGAWQAYINYHTERFIKEQFRE